MKVISTYATTVDALAVAGGPYFVDAGATLTFIGGPNKPDTQYLWDFGDGSTATGATATHAYADDGTYVAKLTTIVNEPGGVTTREFAGVVVRSVKPIVDAGADSTCNEGQVVEYVATFSDREWPDTHTAYFDFGDDTPPVEAPVVETNTAPLAQGSARTTHAYCDNGNYTLTVSVHGEDGTIGTATRRVTALNVPPTVTAHDIFAYPCTPVNLIGCFTDPGWCDTHTATWDFGDCTPSQPAVVREEHKPPADTGLAAATHVYRRCGSYHAVCTVTDKDGASGSAAITVRVVDVVNRDFERGFRNRLAGAVANGWEPYVGGAPAGVAGSAAFEASAGASLFAGENIIVHSGRRSERIAGLGAFTAGMYQSVGANPGWDYQITAWYHLDERGGGRCRLGADPAGGVDPSTGTIVWTEGTDHREWAQLVVRVTASAGAITIFLQAEGDPRGAAAYFDDVLLVPYPCPLGECKAKPQREVCIDWQGRKEGGEAGTRSQDRGFTFSSLTSQPLRLVSYGVPAGQVKLQLPARGMDVDLPFEGDRVVAKIVRYSKQPLKLEARDRTGRPLGETSATGQQNVIETLEIAAAGIASLRFMGGGNESLLVQLCVYQGAAASSDAPSLGRMTDPAIAGKIESTRKL